MIHRVADQVHQRVGQLLEDDAVDTDVGAVQAQGHLFLLLLAQIAYDARQTAGDVFQWHQPGLEDVMVEIVDQSPGRPEGLFQLGPVAVGGGGVEHMPMSDQLAGKVDELVKQVGAHANSRERAGLMATVFLAPVIDEADFGDTADLEHRLFDVILG